MLPPFIIDQIRKREEEDQREQPQIQLPIPEPLPRHERTDGGETPHDDRGVVVIDLFN